MDPDRPSRHPCARAIRRAWAAFFILTFAVVSGCVPDQQPLVLFPAGSCASGTQIQYETFEYDSPCVDRCPMSQGIKDPTCVASCWVHNLGGIVSRNACLRFPSQADLQGMRVRCFSGTGAGAWVSGLSVSYGTQSSCAVVIN